MSLQVALACVAVFRVKAAALKANVPWGLRAWTVFAVHRLVIPLVILAGAKTIPSELMEPVRHSIRLLKMHHPRTFVLPMLVAAAVTADVFVKPQLETVSVAQAIPVQSMTTVQAVIVNVPMRIAVLNDAVMWTVTSVCIMPTEIKFVSKRSTTILLTQMTLAGRPLVMGLELVMWPTETLVQPMSTKSV